MDNTNTEYTVTDNNILHIKDVSLELPSQTGKGTVKILHDINLDIFDVTRKDKVTGQIIGLLGPSGRGKTQLFKVIAGLRKPTTGTVLYKGQPIKRGQVGVVAQKYPLMWHRTVRQNLEMVAVNSGMSKAQAREKADFYLERFGIKDKADMYPKKLSGGQQQRVAIVQQILCSERFILMDEPFSGLDVNMIAEVSDAILEVAALHEENTIIIVSHDYQSTAAVSDVLWFMGFDWKKDDGGELVLEGGRKVPDGNGATIKYQENLMARGFSWRYPSIFKDTTFGSFLLDVRMAFNDL